MTKRLDTDQIFSIYYISICFQFLDTDTDINIVRYRNLISIFVRIGYNISEEKYAISLYPKNIHAKSPYIIY